MKKATLPGLAQGNISTADRADLTKWLPLLFSGTKTRGHQCPPTLAHNPSSSHMAWGSLRHSSAPRHNLTHLPGISLHFCLLFAKSCHGMMLLLAPSSSFQLRPGQSSSGCRLGCMREQCRGCSAPKQTHTAAQPNIRDLLPSEKYDSQGCTKHSQKFRPHLFRGDPIGQ